MICPTCHGSGIDPKAPDRNGPRHRYTTGGHDEDPPCPMCGEYGELDEMGEQLEFDEIPPGRPYEDVIVAKDRL